MRLSQRRNQTTETQDIEGEWVLIWSVSPRAASLYPVIGHWAQVSSSTTRQLNAPSTKGWRRLPSRLRRMNAAP